MQERLLDLCDGAEEDAQQVLQLGLHFFPLSKAASGENR